MPATEITEGREFAHLRHSHGSHLLASGVPLPAASERLGHCAGDGRCTLMRYVGKMTKPRGGGRNFSRILEPNACYQVLPRGL